MFLYILIMFVLVVCAVACFMVADAEDAICPFFLLGVGAVMLAFIWLLALGVYGNLLVCRLNGLFADEGEDRVCYMDGHEYGNSSNRRRDSNSPNCDRDNIICGKSDNENRQNGKTDSNKDLLFSDEGIDIYLGRVDYSAPGQNGIKVYLTVDNGSGERIDINPTNVLINDEGGWARVKYNNKIHNNELRTVELAVFNYDDYETGDTDYSGKTITIQMDIDGCSYTDIDNIEFSIGYTDGFVLVD